MLREDTYGKNVSITEQKTEFGEDYDRIIKYLNKERKDDNDKLVIGRDKKSWRLNNLAFGKIQELMSRLIQENLSIKQTKFNFLLSIATITLAFMALINVAFSGLEFLSNESITLGMKMLGAISALFILGLLVWLLNIITK